MLRPLAVALLFPVAVVACSSDDGGGGAAGAGGTAGGGTAGASDDGGGTGGDGGSSASGGASGDGGTAGNSGASGSAGTGGTAITDAGVDIEVLEIPAPLVEHETVNPSELSMAVDSRGRVHIAWIRDDGNVRDLAYTLVDGAKVVTTTVPVPGSALERAPSLVVDDGDRAQVAFAIQRDASFGTVSGNYAVLFARDSTGDGSFTVEQVSTNPTVAGEDTPGPFDADVDSRPTLALDAAGAAVVNFVAANNSVTASKTNLVLCTRAAVDWIREEVAAPSKVVSAGSAFAMASKLAAERQIAWIDGTDFAPRYFNDTGTRFEEKVVPGFAGPRANRTPLLSFDSGARVYFSWQNTGANADSFVVLEIQRGASAVPVITELTYRRTGSWAPTAVHPTTGRAYFAYQRATPTELRLVGRKPDATPLEIPVNLGAAKLLGARSLAARGDALVLVAGDVESDRLWLVRVATSVFAP